MKLYPALDIQSDDPELLYPVLDDFAPTAIEDRDGGLRAFFASAAARDAAAAALAPHLAAAAIDVSDEDWARRSQQNLAPVTVGRVTIFPSFDSRRPPVDASAVVLIIEPSMGFGTGHHATTRLCLAALQDLELSGLTVLDVGTGSGVLAIAAGRLGAARAVGFDSDADAIQCARENLALNPETGGVAFEVADLARFQLPPADVVTANLTGALLIRSAHRLLEAVRGGGTLVLSGLQSHERDGVRAAFAPAIVAWERHEDGWVGLAMKKP